MATKTDQRARLIVKGAANNIRSSHSSYDTPFLGPARILRRTNGVIFPFTPNINVVNSVEYNMYDLVHTNYQQHAYSRSRNPQIQVTGIFSAQTPDEARYTVGVMHFFRVVTKMHFGSNDANKGTPPPVLEFSAYGTYNFNRVPVLVGNVSFIYDDNTDYVEVDIDTEKVQIPVMTTIAIDLLPQYSPAKQTNEFTLDDFARGHGYKRGFI